MNRHICFLLVLSVSAQSFALAAPAPIALTQSHDTPMVSPSSVPVDIGAVSQNAKQLTTAIDSEAASVPLEAPALAIADASVVILDALVNLGALVWDLFKLGQPTMNGSIDVANALPQGVKGAMDLANWRTPVVQEYCVSLDPNPDFTCDPGYLYANSNLHFRVSFIPGGEFQGHGKYLSGVMVEPAAMQLASNSSLNAQSSVVSISNIGTADEPIAAMRIQFNWLYKTYNGLPFGQSFGILVTGDGRIVPDAKTQITTPPLPLVTDYL